MSLLKKANTCFKHGAYAEAYQMYLQLKKSGHFPFVDFNIELCKKKLGVSRQALSNIHKKERISTVDIIIPIYNALDDVKKCIDSLYEHKTHDFNLITIDDYSDDETKIYLENESKKRNFTLLRNNKNLRFTKTVNRGFKESHGDYVVLLNSDTIVTPRWIEKILACFASDEKIGIVGPLSNAARWQTIPNVEKNLDSSFVSNLPKTYSIGDMAHLVETISNKNYPIVPSVNGFCYVIKREVIDKNGFFDEVYFEDGYGEEDDYSIRTTNSGYKIAVADDTYIYHSKSKSYTHERRKVLSVQGRKSLEKKYGKLHLKKLDEEWNRIKIINIMSDRIKTSLNKGLKNIQNNYQGKYERYEKNNFIGWLVNVDIPSEIVEVSIYIDNVFYARIKSDQLRKDLQKHGKSEGRGGYKFSLPLERLSEANIVTLKNPNNKIFAIIKTSTLNLTKPVVINKISEINDVVRIPNKRNISIIVPIYNAADDLAICIERLLKYTQPHVDIVLIDDASPDSRITKILNTTHNIKNIRVYKNENNLGFTKTVNRGIELAGENDVVLLNSDARVTPRWLEGLLNAASTDAKIATVTPMSDRAGAFSAPKIGNENNLPSGVNEIDFAVAFRRHSVGVYSRVPTGNGFCMFIKRDCINDIGALDAEAFPRGYGEENDFCMRARAKGWSNIIDDRTYVFHDRSKSFGDQKTELMKSGRNVIDRRYPDYKKAISVFSNSENIALARSNANKAVVYSQNKDILPRILYVISSLTGGTPQTNLDLMMALFDSIDPWLLYCDSKTISLYEVQENGSNNLIRQHTLREAVDPLTHLSSEYDRVLANWLYEYDFEIVHIRHLARQSLSLPRLSKEAGAKVIYSMHDFYTLCPTIKLLDGDNNYCGGECTKGGIECKAVLWPSEAFPPLKGQWILQWREKFSHAISYCDAFITTSQSAKNTLVANLKELDRKNFYVIPHGRNFKFEKTEIEYKDVHHILVPGNIDIAKGLLLIKGLLKVDKKKQLHFHILGNITLSELGGFSSSNLTIHGKYKRDEFSILVKKIKPTVGAVLSIWDETWCHTLTELWAVGLPVIALDYGTIKQRIQESGAGWIYQNSSIEKLYTNIVNDLNNKVEFQNRLEAVYRWQEEKALLHTTKFMASSYIQVYSSLGIKKRVTLKERIAVLAPSNSILTKGNGSTYIRLWEKTINRLDREFIYLRMTASQLIIAIAEGLVKRAIMQRNVLTESEWKVLRILVKENKLQYIFELDDDLLNVPKDKDNNSVYKNYRPVLKDIISNAKFLTVSTKGLVQKYRTINKNIQLVPNQLSIRLWKREVKKECVKDAFKMVYIGTSTHMEDFLMILPALELIAKRYKYFSMKLIGIAKSEHYKFPKWVEIVTIPSESKEYPKFVEFIKSKVKDIDIAIAPLADTEFNNNKSYLKILEYAGLSLPVIASKGVVYNELINDAPHMTLVQNTIEEWEKAIEKSISQKDYLHKKGIEMRKWVVENHFINEKRFDALIKDTFEI